MVNPEIFINSKDPIKVAEDFKKYCHNKIYIHIPKCGGTSIWQHGPIRPSQIDKHASVQEILRDNGEDYIKDHKFFTVVRDPFSRMVSWYFFHRHILPPAKGAIYHQYATFKEWVKARCPTHWRPEVKVWSQKSFLTLNDKVIMDDIFKLEELSKNIGTTNTSAHNDYKKYYDKETVQIVTNICNDDLECFDYVPLVI